MCHVHELITHTNAEYRVFHNVQTVNAEKRKYRNQIFSRQFSPFVKEDAK